MAGNKIANKITKNSQQNNSDTVKNENDKEILKETPKEWYTSPKERQEIIDDTRLI